jgi:hypothetical protein
MGTKAGKKRASATQGKPTANPGSSKRSRSAKKPKQTDHELFTEQIRKREEQLDKTCWILEQPLLDEDEDGEDVEPTLAQLHPLRRIYVPKKMVEYYDKVRDAIHKLAHVVSAYCCLQADCSAFRSAPSWTWSERIHQMTCSGFASRATLTRCTPF